MDKTLILNEIKEHLNIGSNKDFAMYLGIKPTTLSMWYSRNTFDIELIFTKCEFLNSEWLLTGKGFMLKQKSGSEKPEPPPPDHHYLIDLVEYQKKHIASLEKEVSQLKKEYTTGETLRMVSEPIEQLKK
jgi:hypothetical protein